MLSRSEHNRKQYLKNREKRLAAQKEYYAANKEARNSYNKEYAEKNKESIRERRNEYRLQNLDAIKERMRHWYVENSDYAKIKAKEYREANKDKTRAWSKEYRKNRMIVDPLFALKIKLRSLINLKISTSGYTKRSKTYEILGCSYVDFKTHIEQQFQKGMSWENHGMWHLDHIVPIASAKTEDDVIRLNHYSNFQPLWAIDNLKKGSKYATQ